MRPNDRESTLELVLCGSPVHDWRNMGGIKEAKLVLKSSAQWIKLELLHLLQQHTMLSLYDTKIFSFKSLTSHRKHEFFSVFAHYNIADRYLQVHVSSLIQLFKKKRSSFRQLFDSQSLVCLYKKLKKKNIFCAHSLLLRSRMTKKVTCLMNHAQR